MTNYNFNDRPSEARVSTLKAEFPNVDSQLVVAFINFQWTYREMQRQYDRLLASYELSESKFLILMFLRQAHKQQLLPSVLAEKLGATRPTVSKLLTGLSKQSFVKKIGNARDKRSSLIQLTEAGNEVLKDLLPYNFTAPQLIFEDFSADELQYFEHLLEKINQGTQKLKTEMENLHNERKN